ncbi:MAG: hypothetical protein KKF56_00205 [Nanoarchaeota archaeon]|nr:hypothetical protein [Nanoarchaeota archaeon]
MIALLLAITAVSATTCTVNQTQTNPCDLVVGGADGLSVNVNGLIDVSSDVVISGEAGESIPVRVSFTAGRDDTDVRVKAYISGYRSEVSDETNRFDVISGSIYSKLLSLRLPSDIDQGEDYTLYVRVEGKTDSVEKTYQFKLQRESYNLEILSVDADEVQAGGTLRVDIVLKNRGSQRVDDNYVTVSIDSLGVSKRAYFGDLTPTDDVEDKEDAEERSIYLQIPTNADSGVYSLEVNAENLDSRDSMSKSVVIRGAEEASEVIQATTTREANANEEVLYDFILVNKGRNIGVYTIVLDNVDNMMSSVDSTIVTVSAGSSKIVTVKAKALKERTYSFGASVLSDGQNVGRANFVLIAEGNSDSGGSSSGSSFFSGESNNLVVLTVILVIIFVVLLIVLIVLMTRKSSTEEESYY